MIIAVANIIGDTFSSTSSGIGPISGDGILLEDDLSFLQLESGDFLLLE